MGCWPGLRITQIRLNIPLFLFLSATLLQIASQPALAAPSDDSYNRHINREETSPSYRTTTVVRSYKLYSRCSGRHISVRGRVVQAKAPFDSQYAWIRIETYSFGSRVRIRSNASHSFLCFSTAGRLTVKHNGKGPRCLFHEIHAANDYTEFRSVSNKRWFIGFNKDGRRLAGDQWRRAKDRSSAKKCYQFIKLNTILHQGAHSRDTGRPKDGETSLNGSLGAPSPGAQMRQTIIAAQNDKK